MAERYASTTYVGLPYADKTVGEGGDGYADTAWTGGDYASKTVANGNYASKLFTDGEDTAIPA